MLRTIEFSGSTRIPTLWLTIMIIIYRMKQSLTYDTLSRLVDFFFMFLKINFQYMYKYCAIKKEKPFALDRV